MRTGEDRPGSVGLKARQNGEFGSNGVVAGRSARGNFGGSEPRDFSLHGPRSSCPRSNSPKSNNPRSNRALVRLWMQRIVVQQSLLLRNVMSRNVEAHTSRVASTNVIDVTDPSTIEAFSRYAGQRLGARQDRGFQSNRLGAPWLHQSGDCLGAYPAVNDFTSREANESSIAGRRRSPTRLHSRRLIAKKQARCGGSSTTRNARPQRVTGVGFPRNSFVTWFV